MLNYNNYFLDYLIFLFFCVRVFRTKQNMKSESRHYDFARRFQLPLPDAVEEFQGLWELIPGGHGQQKTYSERGTQGCIAIHRGSENVIDPFKTIKGN